MKKCTSCRRRLPGTEFTRPSNPWQCRECVNTYMRERRKKTRSRDSAKLKVWGRHGQIRAYGITVDEHDAMFKKQKGRCAICKEKPEGTLHIDHGHKTRKVRGPLCSLCNKALGCFKDSPKILRAAVGYLGK